MKPIPASLLAKLKDRFKSVSLDNDPRVTLIATQTSTNTFLTEPIHEQIPPAFGDVCVRQMAGESDLSLAYAVCLDGGVASVWSRLFPATMDYKWQHVFDLGIAQEAAIEFDGVWKMDEKKVWHYLETEEYPYIFTVEQGVLYVQKWNDADSKTYLADGVTQVSVCKGWTSTDIPEDDQGIVCAYLKSGGVFYRNYCWSDLAGKKVWGVETPIPNLEDTNITLSVFRTNDFRIGFLTEHEGGNIQMALTKRTYSGMSVRPEGVHCGTVSASFKMEAIRRKEGQNGGEHVTAGTQIAFFLFDDAQASKRISVTQAARLYDDAEEPTYCTGGKLTLSYPLTTTDLPYEFAHGVTTSTGVPVTGVAYDADEQAIYFTFDWGTRTKMLLVDPFTATLPANMGVRYTVNGSPWYFDTAVTGTMSDARTHLEATNGTADSVTVSTVSATFAMYPIARHEAYNGNAESVTASTVSATFQLIPVGDIPV